MYELVETIALVVVMVMGAVGVVLSINSNEAIYAAVNGVVCGFDAGVLVCRFLMDPRRL